MSNFLIPQGSREIIVPATTALVALGLIYRWVRRETARASTDAALRRYADLHFFTTRLSSSENPREIAEGALDQALKSLNFEQGCLLLETPAPESLRAISFRGMSSRSQLRLQDALLRSFLMSSAERWGSVMVFPDLRESEAFVAWEREPAFGEFRKLLLAEGLRTAMVVALQIKERSFGALIVGCPNRRRFLSGEVRLMLALGNQISVALENRYLNQTAERQQEEMRTLRRVVEKVSSTFDLQGQLQVLRRELGDLLGTAHFCLTLQDTDGYLETVYASEEPPAGSKGRPHGEKLVDYVLRTGEPLLVWTNFENKVGRRGAEPSEYVLCLGGSPANSADFRHAVRSLGFGRNGSRIRTWAGVPIRFSDRSMGVLAVIDYEREKALDARQFEFLKLLGRGVSVSIENARLFQREQQRARHLALLNEIGRKAAAVLNPQELLASVCSQIRNAFGYDQVSIETLDPEREELVREAQEGYGTESAGTRTHLGTGFAGLAASTGEPVLSNRVKDDTRYTGGDARVRAALSLPLRYGDVTLGVLNFASFREHSFSAQDVLTLQTLADQLAVALHNARAYQVAREEAITDGLTKLKTHRYFMEALDSEWRRAPRKGRHFSLIMVDLDGFKPVNSRSGHVEGDRVLLAVARLLEARSRQSNVLARYGGDEFAILMPDGTQEEAMTLAERLRASMAADPFLSSHGLTGSFGIATFPVHGATPEEILRVADAGMYLAKHEKGNCVRVASAAAASGEWEQQLLQAYLGVAVKRLFATGPEAFNRYLERIQQATQASRGEGLSLLDTVTALAFAIDAKDHYTQGHSQSVSRLAMQLGRHLGLSEADLEEIRLAGILHDIGKIGIPESVLNKPARLTAEEYEVMKTHTVLGDKILEPLKVKAIQRIRLMVRHHHEYYDGHGYPDGLNGDSIPLGARILAIADAFDTMISRRAYKEGLSVAEATSELVRCRGNHFDAALVDAFLKSIESVNLAAVRGVRPEVLN